MYHRGIWKEKIETTQRKVHFSKGKLEKVELNVENHKIQMGKQEKITKECEEPKRRDESQARSYHHFGVDGCNPRRRRQTHRTLRFRAPAALSFRSRRRDPYHILAIKAKKESNPPQKKNGGRN